MKLRCLATLATFLLSINAFGVKPFTSIGLGIGQTHFPDLLGNGELRPHESSNWYVMWGAIMAVSPSRPHRFEGHLGLGYMSESSESTDHSKQKVRWSNFPLEAMYFYHNTQELFRVGWGYTLHLRNDFETKTTGKIRGITQDDFGGWTFSLEKLVYSDGQAPESNENYPQGTSNYDSSFALGVKHHTYTFKDSRTSKKVEGSSTFLTLTIFGID